MNIRNLIIIILFGYTLINFNTSAFAATIYAASANYNDVFTAVSSASVGDTVVVPAGRVTWPSNLIITKGIILKGAGIGNTVITGGASGYIITYSPTDTSSNNAFRLTGFTFITTTSGGFKLYKSGLTTPQTRIRIDHNRFEGTKMVAEVYSPFYGVADNNQIVNTASGHMDNYGLNAITWGNTKDPFTFGSINNFYWEDNVVTTSDGFCSGGLGGRYVYRYNTWNWTAGVGLYSAFDMHGNQDGGNYATMGAEIYGNKIIAGSHNGNLVDLRGGQLLAYFNYISSTGSSFEGGRVRDEYDDSLYPERNSFLQHPNNSYFWNNRRNGTDLLKAIETQDCCNSIAENSEFWNHNPAYNGTTERGIYCGASLPATCTVGDGAWITSQSCAFLSTAHVGANPNTPISGTLYKCTSTNKWTAYYTPLPYPHPLRTEDDAHDIRSPMNLRIISSQY